MRGEEKEGEEGRKENVKKLMKIKNVHVLTSSMSFMFPVTY